MFERIFNGFAGGMSSPPQNQPNLQPVEGNDIRLDLKLDFREAVFGCQKEMEFTHLVTCEACHGFGTKGGALSGTCTDCHGFGQIQYTDNILFGSKKVYTCSTCDGTGILIQEKCQACDGKGVKEVSKKVNLCIPEGVENNTKLRIAQEGDAGQWGGTPGDVYIFLAVNEDPEFQRQGFDILSEVKITLQQAVSGCRLEVNTLDGLVNLTIPPGTQDHTVMKLKNRGVPHLGNPTNRGDHLLTVLVDIPKKITPEERELLKKLDRIKRERTGKGSLEGFLGNLFK